MSVSIGSAFAAENGTEWLGRLCLRYVNHLQKTRLESHTELWADLPLPAPGDRTDATLDIRPMSRAGGLSAVIRLHNQAYVGAADYRRAGWVEAMALQNAKGYDPSHIFVAFRGSVAVGYCMARKKGATGRITGVAVRPEFRRRGYGTTLLRHALNALWARGVTEAYLYADATAPTCRALYRKLGFHTRTHDPLCKQ